VLLAEGHFPKRLRADQAAAILTRIHATNEIARQRKALAREHLAKVRHAGHYARYNGTAPIDASSGNHIRHRLNPDGNRQLNHALYVAALGQISHDTPGRDHYLRKQTEGHTRKEALRALKRRISDAVYRQMVTDARR